MSENNPTWTRFRELIGPDATKTSDADLLSALELLPGQTIGFHHTGGGWVSELTADDVDVVLAALTEYRRRNLVPSVGKAR